MRSLKWQRQNHPFFLHCWFLLIGSLLLGCQSTQKNIKNERFLPTPYGVVQEKLQKITETGSNRYPNVAPDNQQLLYVSSLRDKHAHSQIYMLNLGSKKEKRLTYQDGNIINPQFFLNTQQVIYESTTDEDKEWPYLVGKYSTSLKSPPLATKTIELFNDLLPLNNFEIYLSDNAGYSIRRLTDSRYFDGTTFILNAKELIFSSFQRQQIDLYKLKYQKRKWRRFRLTHTPEHELQAQVHKASAKMAWVRMDKEFLYSHIFIGDLNAKKGEVIDTGVHYSFHPQWHPSGQYLIFTSNLANYDNYEIYAFDLKTQCLLRLTYLTSNELDPTFSPDGQYIYFSSNLEDSFQIYRMKFNPPISCPVEQNSARL